MLLGGFVVALVCLVAFMGWSAAMRSAGWDSPSARAREVLLSQVKALDTTVKEAEQQWKPWMLKTFQPVTPTAYNSVSWQTDDDPWVTASGALAGAGTIALSRNLIRPENDLMVAMGYNPTAAISFGDTVYVVYVVPMVVNDTMHRRYNDRADIWMADIELARAWGVRQTFLAY